MSTEVDREAFMRLMGLTAADVADPDSMPKRATSRMDAPPPSAGGAAAAAATLRSTSSCHRASSPVSSSAAGLSHSASLRGDSEHASNFYTHTKASLQRSSASTSSTACSDAALKSGVRFASAETQSRHRGGAATASSSPRPTSVGTTLKEAGNEAFEAGRFVEAIQHYSAAIEAISGDGTAAPATADNRDLFGALPGSTTTGRPCEVELLAALHSNRSAAYLQAARQWSSAEEAYGRALCDADRAVALRPSWFKGYSRQGDAYFKLRRYGTAAEAYEMALQLDPRNTTLANALAETRQRAKQSAREELELRRTMRSTGVSSHMSSTGFSEDRLDAQPVGVGATSTASFGDAGHATGEPRRSSGYAQQRWEVLKHEVEATTHAPTGDAYRLQQLERFRQRGGPAAASESRRPFASTQKHDTTPAECHDSPHRGSPSTPGSRHTTPTPPSSRPRNDHHSAGTHDSSFPPSTATNTAAAAVPASAAATTTAARTATTCAIPAPAPPPRRSTYDSPTSGGIPAAMANFSGPVTSARDVPYEFSSAAASAYQQKLLEAFRERKAKQP